MSHYISQCTLQSDIASVGVDLCGLKQDEKGNEYHCPLGKKLVDFADESHFSRIAM